VFSEDVNLRLDRVHVLATPGDCHSGQIADGDSNIRWSRLFSLSPTTLQWLAQDTRAFSSSRLLRSSPPPPPRFPQGSSLLNASGSLLSRSQTVKIRASNPQPHLKYPSMQLRDPTQTLRLKTLSLPAAPRLPVLSLSVPRHSFLSPRNLPLIHQLALLLSYHYHLYPNLCLCPFPTTPPVLYHHPPPNFLTSRNPTRFSVLSNASTPQAQLPLPTP
jgi:hypothetical protein